MMVAVLEDVNDVEKSAVLVSTGRSSSGFGQCRHTGNEVWSLGCGAPLGLATQWRQAWCGLR